MKKLIYLISLLILMALTILSCTNEDLTNTLNNDGNDIAGMLKINYSLSPAVDVSITRANSNPIENLMVFVFNEDGAELMTDKPIYFESANNGSTTGLKEVNYPSLGQTVYNGWVRIKLKDGYNEMSKAKVFLIANAGSDLPQYKGNIKEQIIGFTTMKQLTEFACQYQETIDRQESKYLMSSAGIDVNGYPDNEYSEFTPTIAEWSKYIIPLSRMDAKINFNISTEACDFKLQSYEVHNAPKKGYLIWKYYLSEGGSINEKSTLFDKDAAHADDDFFKTEIEYGESNPTQFTFHIAENLKRPITFFDNKKFDNKKEKEKEKLKTREKHNLDTDETYNFINAPKRATYIILKGVLTKENSSIGPIVADVSYIIHLGFKNENNSASSWENYNGNINDYITRRNYEYTYNVKIKGVNDIIAEVTSNNDMPQAEGIITSKENIDLKVSESSPFKVNENEIITMEAPDADGTWIKLKKRDITIKDWIDEPPIPGNYNLIATGKLPEGMNSRQLVLLATRTSTDGRSKIIRRITITQQQIP